MGLRVLLLVLGENLHNIFTNHGLNGFYFYHHQLTTRIKNFLPSNFQSVELCSADGFTVGLNHLPFRGFTITWTEVPRAAKQIQGTT